MRDEGTRRGGSGYVQSMKPIDRPDVSPADPCAGCQIAAGSSRRDFIRDASLAAAAVLVGLGMNPARALAEPLHLITSLSNDGSPASYPVPVVDGVSIDRKNEVILVRAQNAVYAFNLSCPHQNTALKWDAKANRFECPKHHSRYTADGTFIDGRATRGMDRFKISRTGDTITVDLNTLYQQDKRRAEWNGAMVKLT
jgi:nitrite reductase/ring-hydroxylating ferredoxin subunit